MSRGKQRERGEREEREELDISRAFHLKLNTCGDASSHVQFRCRIFALDCRPGCLAGEVFLRIGTARLMMARGGRFDGKVVPHSSR